MDKQQLKLKNAQSRVNEEVQIHYRLRNSYIVQVRKDNFNLSQQYSIIFCLVT